MHTWINIMLKPVTDFCMMKKCFLYVSLRGIVSLKRGIIIWNLKLKYLFILLQFQISLLPESTSKPLELTFVNSYQLLSMNINLILSVITSTYYRSDRNSARHIY